MGLIMPSNQLLCLSVQNLQMLSFPAVQFYSIRQIAGDRPLLLLDHAHLIIQPSHTMYEIIKILIDDNDLLVIYISLMSQECLNLSNCLL